MAEEVVKTSKNCAFKLWPGSLTLTSERLLFKTLIGKKAKVDLPLDGIAGVRPFGPNMVQVDTPDGGFYRIQVSAMSRGDWVEAIERAISG